MIDIYWRENNTAFRGHKHTHARNNGSNYILNKKYNEKKP